MYNFGKEKELELEYCYTQDQIDSPSAVVRSRSNSCLFIGFMYRKTMFEKSLSMYILVGHRSYLTKELSERSVEEKE